LTGEPEGTFTVSYNSLAPLVCFAEWTGAPNFTELTSDTLAQPDFLGTRGSPMGDLIFGEQHGVELSASGLEPLVTWMDANALFYGTFDPEDQARQLRGERIEGPALE